ncbi:MAG: helix-turn-helix transcriptional regulator [Ignavibacteriae bacterium]|nr:helix-turn-helix transcriptional regulator [Ignavibacteriota bacterium]MCB9217194.1 helix-turn-helix transcriptional regulator [Ignavibacteria bacterium]
MKHCLPVLAPGGNGDVSGILPDGSDVQTVWLKTVAVVTVQLEYSRRSTTLASGGFAIVTRPGRKMRNSIQSTQLRQCIGRRVRRFRLRAGITAQQLAMRSGTTFQKIQVVEAGTGRISMCHLLRIAKVLDITLGDLLRGVSVYSNVHVWSVYPVK